MGTRKQIVSENKSLADAGMQDLKNMWDDSWEKFDGRLKLCLDGMIKNQTAKVCGEGRLRDRQTEVYIDDQV